MNSSKSNSGDRPIEEGSATAADLMLHQPRRSKTDSATPVRPVNLVVNTAFLGDLILSIPFFEAIKRLYPNDDLILICRSGIGSYLKSLQVIDDYYEIKKGQSDSYAEAQGALSTRKIRNVYCPHRSFRSAWFVRGLKAERKVGFFSRWNFFFFDQRKIWDGKLPEAVRQMSLLSLEDAEIENQIEEYKKSGEAYRISENGQLSAPPKWALLHKNDFIFEQSKEWTDLIERLSLKECSDRPWVLLFPGSVWATKRWTESGFIELGQALAQSNQILVMGGPGEEELCQRLSSKIIGSINLCAKTSIYESQQVIARADLVVANDSASAHMACLVDVPLLVCFGPTVIEFGYRPWGSKVWVAQLAGLACRPCGPHGHHKCPRATHECMVNLSSKLLIGMAEQILSLCRKN